MPLRCLALAIGLFIAGAGAAVAQSGGIEVANAWARATPGGAETGVVYLTIRSPGADRLVGISTAVAKTAAVHATTMTGMVMRMRPLAALDIPADKPVTLKPGGLHIMLEGLKAPLRAGRTFAIDLHFAKAGTRRVTVAVEKSGAMSPPP